MVIIFGHVDGSNEPQKGQVLFFLLWSALVVTADAKKAVWQRQLCALMGTVFFFTSLPSLVIHIQPRSGSVHTHFLLIRKASLNLLLWDWNKKVLGMLMLLLRPKIDLTHKANYHTDAKWKNNLRPCPSFVSRNPKRTNSLLKDNVVGQEILHAPCFRHSRGQNLFALSPECPVVIRPRLISFN